MKLNPPNRLSQATLLVALACAGTPLAAQSNPDLLAYEGFEYATGSRLELLNGGTGWGTAWMWRQNFSGGGSVVEGGAIIEEGSLFFDNLATQGNHVRLSGEVGNLELGRGFAETIDGEPGTTTWVSYLGQRVGPMADPTAPSYGGSYPWGSNLYPRGASIRLWSQTSERLSIGNFSNQALNEWAFYGSGLPLLHSGNTFSDSVDFVVVRVDHRADPAGDNIYLWINPDLDVIPDPGSADILLENVTEDQEAGSVPVHVGSLSWVSPFAGSASLDGLGRVLRPHAELLVDELRIGRTYAAVAPVEYRWAGFRHDLIDTVDTGRFMGSLQTAQQPWIWSYSLETWVYVEESSVGSNGGWVHFRNNGSVGPADGVPNWRGLETGSSGYVNGTGYLGWVYPVDEHFIWNATLQTWMYSPASLFTATEATLFVYDLNAGEVVAPLAALAPRPRDGDEHVDTDFGELTLSWRAGQAADMHHLYIGLDEESVASAERGSPEYYASTGGQSVALQGTFPSMQRIFWRVDAENTYGTAKGEVWSFRPRQLAFPGAEGYGRFAVGGRHGRVVKVTNLNDSGPGSLRAAIEDETGPRIVVFDVGGLITLEDDITVQSDDDHLTIAGQTAPGKGITIRKNKLGISGVEDVIMRFLRIRLGNLTNETSDGTGMQGSNHSIFDHVTVSWSIDEAFSSRNARNITLQRSMLAEALNEAGHKNYPEGSRHGYAASVGGDIASLHHNLLVHCAGRNWSLAGGLDSTGEYKGQLDIRNNVVYNWDKRTTDGGAHKVNFVNNYYKAGPATRTHFFLNPQRENVGTGAQDFYVSGNILDDPANEVGPENQEDGITNPGASWYMDEPFFPSYVTTQSAREAYKQVLSDVGCSRPAQDAHEIRVIEETMARSYTYSGSRTGFPGLPDNESDVGGWENYPEIYRAEDFDTDDDGLPDWYEDLVGTNPDSPPGDFSDMRSDPDGDGFTLMDDYLAWMALPTYDVEQDGSVRVDLHALTRGFVLSPVYSVTDVPSGTAEVDGSELLYTPAEGFTGIVIVEFQVADAEGDSMQRTIGFRIGIQ